MPVRAYINAVVGRRVKDRERERESGKYLPAGKGSPLYEILTPFRTVTAAFSKQL